MLTQENTININKLIKSLIRLQLIVKVVHWTTENYNTHKITDELYSELNDFTDRMVETYQGIVGTLPISEFDIKFYPISEEELIRYLYDVIDSVMKNVYMDLPENMKAIMDEMLEKLRVKIYLLRMN
jgi:DNA-binding ferritin-like protein